MQFKITGVRIKELPSKFGGTWKLAEVKVEGRGDTKFELQGYGSKFVERVKAGDILKGYEGKKEFNGVTTPTINKITAEYVYDMLMEMKGTPEAPAAPRASTNTQDDGWNSGGGNSNDNSDW